MQIRYIICYKLVRLHARKYSLPTHFKRKIGFSSNTTVLGIETSCDDTGCAIINGKGNLMSESLYSQNITHLRYGGVNPRLARELHHENIEKAVYETLCKADMNIDNIDYLAVTTKPGLLASLQVGVSYAKYLAKKHNKPLIPIHHMEAHALVARMYHTISFPYLALLISGGHCLLAVVRDTDDFLLLGNTLDNAPGEVLDKGARRMKLRNIPEYSKLSGGKAIELAACKAIKPIKFTFPLPLARNRDCNFSFSGLKDAFQRQLEKEEFHNEIIADGIIPEVNELCAAYQLAIAKHIAHRTERAVIFCEFNKLIGDSNKSIVVSGGVACNDFIFKCIQLIGHKLNYNVYRPPPKVCTDNGIMIAWNGIEKLQKKCNFEEITLKDIDPIAPLGRNIINEVSEAYIRVKAPKLNNL